MAAAAAGFAARCTGKLRGLPPVRAFRLDPANDGVTIVEL